MALEDLLAAEGLVAEARLHEAVDRARDRGEALVSVLVEERYVPEDALADAVARAVGTVVVDVEIGSLDRESVRLIPERSARRFLVVAVARGAGGRTLRVAFANPLDDDAVAMVRETTGLDVEPMVATVSGLKAALDREYRGTEILRAVPPGDGERPLAPEDTRELARSEPIEPTPTQTGTAPMHRVEQDATIEQRHEALLLALVDAGVLTRADYIAALRRLGGRK